MGFPYPPKNIYIKFQSSIFLVEVLPYSLSNILVKCLFFVKSIFFCYLCSTFIKHLSANYNLNGEANWRM